MDRTPDDPKDLDLTDPQVSALTTPDLDGDDIKVVKDVDAENKPEPADGDLTTPEARPA